MDVKPFMSVLAPKRIKTLAHSNTKTLILISAKRGEAREKLRRRRRKILAENQSPEAALLYSSFVLFV